ncbi:serine hydrolase domain-containing protein [Dielma fastidiosa]|uniref:Beta-lactamase family protein n=1 Tax=Dielma fastidiosa TaxID=1034346 RepID=A0AB35UKJ5_9FIRM|nr:serine hydrolase domain-containing protein [Dielma fastidiosa]MDY5166624.1 beta-lactamase family protein [Dielma fastidiosa]
MKKTLSFLLAGVLAFSSLFSMNVQAASDSVQTMADTLIQNYGVTSLQYALIDNGEIITSGTSGVYSKSENRLLTKDNMYTIGSTSKMFVTASIMKLVDEGKIDLDKPVKDYVPEFRMKDSRYRKITVRMLLNHSSGLMGSTYLNGFLFNDNDTQAHDSFLKDLREQELKADPGAYSVYSNDSFTLAEIVIEKVSGESFTEYIRKNITEPLSLTHTKTPLDDFDRSLVAKTYYPNTPMLANGVDNANIIGTGGIYSTAEELCKFAQIYMKNNSLLSAESKKATFQKEYLRGQWLADEPNIINFGLGWDSVNLDPFASYGIQAGVKGGDTLLMHSSLIVLPEYNMAAAVTSSGGSSLYDQILATQLLMDRLYEKGIIKGAETLPVPSQPVQKALDGDLKKYEGYYANFGGIYRVDLSDDGLLTYKNAYLEGNEQAATMIYVGDGQFVDPTGNLAMYFMEQNGNTYLNVNGASELPGIGRVHEHSYFAQKVELSELSDSVAKAWAAREDKGYLSILNKYTSQAVATVLPVTSVALKGNYLSCYRVIDANTAVPEIEIPMSGSRDVGIISFYKEDGIEYMKLNDNLFVSEDAIKEVHRDSFSVRINDKGYNQYYYAGPEYEGKNISITVPENAGYVVYDSTGIAVLNSVNSKPESFPLGAGCYILFMGDAGARFKVEIKD